MIADAPVIHVEIGVHETGFQVGAQQIVSSASGGFSSGGSRFCRTWSNWLTGTLMKSSFTGDESIPTGCILGDKFDFDAIREWRNPAFEPFQAVGGTALSGSKPSASRLKGSSRKCCVAHQDRTWRCMKSCKQAIGTRAHRDEWRTPGRNAQRLLWAPRLNGPGPACG